MPNIEQKRKLAALLTRLGGSGSDMRTYIGALNEIERTTRDISKAPDIAPLSNDVSSLRSLVASHGTAISAITDKMASLRDEIVSTLELSDKKSIRRIDESLSKLLDFEDKLEALRKDFTRKLAERTGGGGLYRDIKKSGAGISLKYADINFIPGSGVTFSLADDNTNRRVNWTISSSGGPGATFSVETPAGAIDDSNTTFTTVNTINTVIGLYRNGEYLHPDAYTFSGNILTMNAPLGSVYSLLPFTIVYV